MGFPTPAQDRTVACASAPSHQYMRRVLSFGHFQGGWSLGGGCPSAVAAAAAAKSLQSCPTLCDPIDGNPPGTSVPGLLQARILEWVAISFSSAILEEGLVSLSFFFFLIIYLFLVALGLHCCLWAFSCCGKGGLFFVVVRVGYSLL